MDNLLDFDKNHITILNQIFDMEQKIGKLTESNSLRRNIDRLKNIYEHEVLPAGQRLIYHNPIGEPYNETRIDCEASISGDSTENLKIVEVIKPIIRIHTHDIAYILQKAVVIVKGA